MDGTEEVPTTKRSTLVQEFLPMSASRSVSLPALLAATLVATSGGAAGGIAGQSAFARSWSPRAQRITGHTCGGRRLDVATAQVPAMRMGAPKDEGQSGRAQRGEGENVIEVYRKILAEVEIEDATAQSKIDNDRSTLFGQVLRAANLKTCETDRDCVPGRCINVILSKICVWEENDDGPGGGGRIASMAMEPIPVRIEDGYYDDDTTTNSGGMCPCTRHFANWNRRDGLVSVTRLICWQGAGQRRRGDIHARRFGRCAKRKTGATAEHKLMTGRARSKPCAHLPKAPSSFL